MLLDFPFFMRAKRWNIPYTCHPACLSAVDGGFCILHFTVDDIGYWLVVLTVEQWHKWPHLAHPKSIPSEMKCLNVLQRESSTTSPVFYCSFKSMCVLGSAKIAACTSTVFCELLICTYTNVLVRKLKWTCFFFFASSIEDAPLILMYFIISAFRDRNTFNPQSYFVSGYIFTCSELTGMFVIWIILMPFWASLCGLFADFLSGRLHLYCLICLVPSGNNFPLYTSYKILCTERCSCS